MFLISFMKCINGGTKQIGLSNMQTNLSQIPQLSPALNTVKPAACEFLAILLIQMSDLNLFND